MYIACHAETDDSPPPTDLGEGKRKLQRHNVGVHGLHQPLIYTNPIVSAENQRPTTE